jgi:hypothetical protein
MNKPAEFMITWAIDVKNMETGEVVARTELSHTVVQIPAVSEPAETGSFWMHPPATARTQAAAHPVQATVEADPEPEPEPKPEPEHQHRERTVVQYLREYIRQGDPVQVRRIAEDLLDMTAANGSSEKAAAK